MSGAIHLAPIGIAALAWYALYRVNRHRGWFRLGEPIFWDAILLIVVFLLWPIWF